MLAAPGTPPPNDAKFNVISRSGRLNPQFSSSAAEGASLKKTSARNESRVSMSLDMTWASAGCGTGEVELDSEFLATTCHVPVSSFWRLKSGRPGVRRSIEVSRAGAQTLGTVAAELAYGEGLQAHARAAEMRLNPVPDMRADP